MRCSCSGRRPACAVCCAGSGGCQWRQPCSSADLSTGTAICFICHCAVLHASSGRLRVVCLHSMPGCTGYPPLQTQPCSFRRCRQRGPTHCRRSASLTSWRCQAPPWGTAARSLPQHAQRPGCGCNMRCQRSHSATPTWRWHLARRCTTNAYRTVAAATSFSKPTLLQTCAPNSLRVPRDLRASRLPIALRSIPRWGLAAGANVRGASAVRELPVV